MNSVSKIVGPFNGSVINKCIYLCLPILVLGISYFISHAKPSIGFTVPIGIIAIGIAVLSVLFPLFGLYSCVFISYFIFDLLRFLNSDLPLVTSLDILVYLTFFGVVINKIIRKEVFWNNAKSPILFAQLAVLIYFCLEFFNPNGGSPELFFLIFRRYITLMLFLFCALQLLKDYAAIRQFFVIWLALAFLTGLYGCYEQWVGLPKFEYDYITANPLRQALSSLDNGDFRKSSFVAGCTDFGLLMAGTVIIALAFFLQLPTSPKKKYFFLFAAIIMVLGMFYSGTRTATFMLTLEICLYILMTINKKGTVIFSLFFVLAFAAILIVPSYGNGTIQRIKSTFEISKDESLNVRDMNRKYIQPYIYAHPMGGGIGTTGLLNYQYNIGHPLAGFPTDSGLLSIVLECGWIGLLIQCISYFVILQQGIKAFFRSKNSKYKPIFLAATISLFGYIFAQYAQIAISQVPSALLFYALMAIIIRLRQIELDNKIYNT